jgi:tRNA/rRNA methyltransferase
VVEPLGFDRTQAARLAAGADDVLERMRVVRTLDEALDDCVDVVMTSGREIDGALSPEQAAARLLSCDGECALVFGNEVRGLTNQDLRRASAVATVPTAHKSSLNLAQAVMVFGYEILKGRGAALPLEKPRPAPATEEMLQLLRGRARALLLSAGFLNPQQPDRVLDELIAVLRRARATRREVELLLAAAAQLERTRIR